MPSLNESIIEDAALEWFGELGYAVGHGPHLAPREPATDRGSFGEVVLIDRLREAIRRLNPAIRWLNRAIPEEGSGNSQGILVSTKHIERRMKP